MNEEIRKIINDLEFCSGALDYMIPPDYCELLFNYIINMQQENEQLKEILHNINTSDGVTTTPVLDLIKENQQLKEQLELYENGVIYDSRVDKLESVLDEIREYIDNYDVFKEFSFPLMKRDEENQVKSSIDYEFQTSIKKSLLQILDKVKE